MIDSTRIRAAACALPLLLAGGATAAPAPTDAWANWSLLRLQARSVPLFWGKVELNLQHEREHGRYVLETSTVARFLGAVVSRSETRSVIDAASGRPISYESHSRKRGRRYRFGASGYTVERTIPEGERWVSRSSKEFAYPADDEGGYLPVFDYYGMLLRLRDLPLHDPGDEVTLYVATSDGPKPFRIRVGEARTRRRTIDDPGDGPKRSLDVRELRLRVTPAEPGAEDEGFLEFEGETELWVEANSKALLHLSGKARKIPGRIRLELDAMR